MKVSHCTVQIVVVRTLAYKSLRCIIISNQMNYMYNIICAGSNDVKYNYSYNSFFFLFCTYICTYMYQILMTDLDPKFMALFSTQAYSSSEELTRDVGLLDLIPGCVLDSKIFEPCGYSLNAIIKV